MIIGLSGKRGTGKTTAADYLVKKYKAVKLSFADDLRALAKQIFPFSDLDFSSVGRKENPWKHYDWSPREFAIHLGEFCRYHDRNYWLDRAMAKAKDDKTLYVFDDTRFQNEAKAIKDKGGKIVRINRYEKHNPFGKNLDLPSETDLDKYEFDFVVHELHNVKLDGLYGQLDLFMSDNG